MNKSRNCLIIKAPHPSFGVQAWTPASGRIDFSPKFFVNKKPQPDGWD